jgi:hypothetical protein
MGSNKTFERLTAFAEGKYVAYCDQDDIWEDNKIELLVNRLEKTARSCAPRSSISARTARPSRRHRRRQKRHVFKEGSVLRRAERKQFVTAAP